MGQETVVLALSADERQALKDRLAGGPFEYRTVPHADFSVKGEGVVATLYRSGKLVVQGAEARVFTLRYLDRSPDSKEPSTGAGPAEVGVGLELPPGQAVVGSDEAGKGDYFGPLVVCALRLPAEHREGVVRSGVTDSKKLSDDRVRLMAQVLEKSFDHTIERLDPVDYNAAYREARNLNPMLADLHARAIRRLSEDGDVVVVDRFANESLIAARLEGVPIDLHQFTRAEREPAVAAASVIARAAFLDGLDALSAEHTVDLRKGAGEPTDAAAREFVSIHGTGALERVAKLHFKNTSKLAGVAERDGRAK